MSEWLDHVPQKLTLAELERDYVIRALIRHRGNRTHAARALGISLRTLRNKLNRYKGEGVHVPPPPDWSAVMRKLYRERKA